MIFVNGLFNFHSDLSCKKKQNNSSIHFSFVEVFVPGRGGSVRTVQFWLPVVKNKKML